MGLIRRHHCRRRGVVAQCNLSVPGRPLFPELCLWPSTKCARPATMLSLILTTTPRRVIRSIYYHLGLCVWLTDPVCGGSTDGPQDAIEFGAHGSTKRSGPSATARPPALMFSIWWGPSSLFFFFLFFPLLLFRGGDFFCLVATPLYYPRNVLVKKCGTHCSSLSF